MIPENKVALVTGASRGIGASIAEMLAQRGTDVVINYRSKASRAEEVAKKVQAKGGKSLLAQADIVRHAEVQSMMDNIKTVFGRLDILVLNASGGLEKDVPGDYAMQLNKDAQINLVNVSLPLMPAGSSIVFVTSHLAHFYGRKPVYAYYAPVAKSKQAGEAALRERIPEFSAKGIRLIIVSGDLIEGTITPKLMERQNRGLIEARREESGALPTVEEFARAIIEAVLNPELESGHTVFVGNTEWQVT